MLEELLFTGSSVGVGSGRSSKVLMGFCVFQWPVWNDGLEEWACQRCKARIGSVRAVAADEASGRFVVKGVFVQV